MERERVGLYFRSDSASSIRSRRQSISWSPQSVRLPASCRVGDLRNYRLLLSEAGHDEDGGGDDNNAAGDDAESAVYGGRDGDAV